MRIELIRLGVAVLAVVFTVPSLGRSQEQPSTTEVKALIRQLQDKDEAIRLKAAKSLGKLGRHARGAIPALTEALKDDDADVRAVAKQSLAKIQAAVQAEDLDARALLAEVQVLKDKLASAEKSAAEQEARFKQSLDGLARQLKEERARADEARAAAIDAKSQAAKESELAKIAQVEAARRVAELRKLEEALKESRGALADRSKEMAKLRDDLITQTIEAKSLTERQRQLEKECQRLAAELAVLKKGGDPTLPGRADRGSPPTEKVRGKIVKVDKSSGLIQLNIGSDAEIAKGHTLEAFRLDPPTYLGRVRIIDVSPHASVAQRVGGGAATRTPLQEGDQVASSIAGAIEEDAPRKTTPDRKLTSGNVKGLHVAVAGVIDLEKNGHDDTKALLERLQGAGVLIDAYTDLRHEKVVGSITVKTDYLILGGGPMDERMANETARIRQKAEELGVQVLTVAQFLKMTDIEHKSRPSKPGK
jgi:hypothetical protein